MERPYLAALFVCKNSRLDVCFMVKLHLKCAEEKRNLKKLAARMKETLLGVLSGSL